jgi:hypothetical protein
LVCAECANYGQRRKFTDGVAQLLVGMQITQPDIDTLPRICFLMGNFQILKTNQKSVAIVKPSDVVGRANGSDCPDYWIIFEIWL